MTPLADLSGLFQISEPMRGAAFLRRSCFEASCAYFRRPLRTRTKYLITQPEAGVKLRSALRDLKLSEEKQLTRWALMSEFS